jgi:hypothetical protein
MVSTLSVGTINASINSLSQSDSAYFRPLTESFLYHEEIPAVCGFSILNHKSGRGKPGHQGILRNDMEGKLSIAKIGVLLMLRVPILPRAQADSSLK